MSRRTWLWLAGTPLLFTFLCAIIGLAIGDPISLIYIGWVGIAVHLLFIWRYKVPK